MEICASYAYIDRCPPATSHNLQLGMRVTHYRSPCPLPYRGALLSNQIRRVAYAIFNTHYATLWLYVYFFEYTSEQNRSLLIVRSIYQLNFVKSMNKRRKQMRKKNTWHSNEMVTCGGRKNIYIHLKWAREEGKERKKRAEEGSKNYKDWDIEI
jgi:hypothetical protein